MNYTARMGTDSGRFNLKGLLLLSRLKTRVKMMVFIRPLSLSSFVSSGTENLGVKMSRVRIPILVLYFAH